MGTKNKVENAAVVALVFLQPKSPVTFFFNLALILYFFLFIKKKKLCRKTLNLQNVTADESI